MAGWDIAEGGGSALREADVFVLPEGVVGPHQPAHKLGALDGTGRLKGAAGAFEDIKTGQIENLVPGRGALDVGERDGRSGGRHRGRRCGG